MKNYVTLSALIAVLALQTANLHSQETKVETRIGDFAFTHDFANGYPTDETVDEAVRRTRFPTGVSGLHLGDPGCVSVADEAHVRGQLKDGQGSSSSETFDDRQGGLTLQHDNPVCTACASTWRTDHGSRSLPEGDTHAVPPTTCGRSRSQQSPSRASISSSVLDKKRPNDADGYKVFQSPSNSNSSSRSA